MPAPPPIPVLHVRAGPAGAAGAGELPGLARRLSETGGVRQRSVSVAPRPGRGGVPPAAGGRPDAGFLPAGLAPGGLLAVGRALRRLVAADPGERRPVQWPVPDRWAVAHAHGAAALRSTWVAAALVGSGARLLARPLPGATGRDGVPAGPWRKADLVAAPDRAAAGALARCGVERRRIRVADPGDAEAALRLYRRLARAERRRVQRVDWRAAE